MFRNLCVFGVNLQPVIDLEFCTPIISKNPLKSLFMRVWIKTVCFLLEKQALVGLLKEIGIQRFSVYILIWPIFHKYELIYAFVDKYCILI